jgi:hypothetical protein
MKVISSKRMVIKESYELSVKDIPFFSFEKNNFVAWAELAPAYGTGFCGFYG